jgi:hypothetical protein
MMHYIIYKITNKVNGRYYIGRHATKNLDDGYMGSGKGIKNALEKYGIDNFTKEIIATAETSQDLWQLEKDIVNESIVKDPLSYNISYGGKHYLDGLSLHDNAAFIDHQRSAGRLGGKASIAKRDSVWHAKGGSIASRKNAALYRYKLTTADGEIFQLDGNSLKALCKDKGWNYDTLIWTRHKDRPVLSGPLKGFRLDQISNPKRKVTC